MRNQYPKENNNIKASGIYSFNFFNSTKLYIGSAIDLCKRGSEHISALKGNRHKNQHFQNAFNLYGEDQLEFVIAEIVNVEHINERKDKIKYLKKVEQGYLDLVLKADKSDKEFREMAYNISKTAEGCSKTVYDKKLRNLKKILVFDLNMKLVEETHGVRFTEIKYNVSGISKCCKARRGRVGNYIFRYEEYKDVQYKRKEYSSKGKKNSNVRPVFEYDALTGNFIKEWRCAEDIKMDNVSRVLSGQYKQLNGKIYKYTKEDAVPTTEIKKKHAVEIYTEDNKLVGVFESYNQAANFIGMARDNVAKRAKDGKLTRKNKYRIKLKDSTNGVLS